jgi:hypothetical protein
MLHFIQYRRLSTWNHTLSCNRTALLLIGFTSAGVPGREISGKMDRQRSLTPLAPSFRRHNITDLLHMGLCQEHCLVITGHQNWRSEKAYHGFYHDHSHWHSPQNTARFWTSNVLCQCYQWCPRWGVLRSVRTGLWWRSRHIDQLRTGRSGNRILMGDKLSVHFQALGPTPQPRTQRVPGFFPACKSAGAWR